MKQQKLPAIYLLLIPGKDGVTFLKSWPCCAVEKYQPQTAKSYLMTLSLFSNFSVKKVNHYQT